MPDGEKPYRVYRSGRGRGRLRLPASDPREPRGRRGTTGAAPRRRRLRVGKILSILLALFLLWLIAWVLIGYFSFRGGVDDANGRVSKGARAQLTHRGGMLISHSTTILVLGTDHASYGGREGDQHSDSIMLVRTDPDHHRIYYLSIPRDLYVEIPGHGNGRINSAFQIGGPALALATVRRLTGLDPNHLIAVDFSQFRDLIDAVGGIDVDVKKPILSNRFDCPFKTQEQCATWPGWRFEKGRQHMDGRRALVYSRIRENRLDPAENDLTRAERQQQVTQALGEKLASVGTFLDLPFVGGKLAKPLSTDLSTGDLVQLGWVTFRANASKAVHCRLGGDLATVGGASVITSVDENRQAILTFTGESAPVFAPQSTYGPGCVVGTRPLAPPASG